MAWARRGMDGGGCGKSFEFTEHARTVLRRATHLSFSDINGRTVTGSNLLHLLDNPELKVCGMHHAVYLSNGREVDAKNDPQKLRIEYNVINFEKLTDAERKQLAVHELLGLKRVPDPGYMNSAAILRAALPGVKDGVYPNWRGLLPQAGDSTTVHGSRAKDIYEVLMQLGFSPMGMTSLNGQLVNTISLLGLRCHLDPDDQNDPDWDPAQHLYPARCGLPRLTVAASVKLTNSLEIAGWNSLSGPGYVGKEEFHCLLLF